jgi:glycosyltransferase A (GT-A) superfamily protein (DUF2064 family)
MLGGDARIEAVEQMLERRAHDWARAVAGESGAVVDHPSLGAALAGDGPTLLVWPELPLWLPETGSAALGDLQAGCTVSIGPVFDGRLYLLALARPIPDLVEALSAGPTMGHALRVVEERKLEVGLLRAERGLREPDDVRALLADPLTDAELLGLLG